MSNALDIVSDFKLLSKTLKNNETLPDNQVLEKGNISPDLSWINIPNNTKSFAIICHDPDAPTGNDGWYHWVLINIPKDVTSIDENGKIKGSTQTITDFGYTGFGGAHPPVGHGIHHYNFTIYALDIEKLDINEDTNPREVKKEVLKHTIKSDTITGLYERN